MRYTLVHWNGLTRFLIALFGALFLGVVAYSAEPTFTAAQRDWWSLKPVVKPAVPEVKNRQWVKTPIDAFVLASLEAKGLAPNPAADRVTLLRRASIDITGLPPTEEEIAQFVNDKSPTAWARVVDRLLGSPQYGERWGRHWLDVVRYSDTAGDNSDYPIPQMSRYRDWVIDAFNRNMPFDQFTIEQLAGDLLPNPTLDQLISTGFNRCNITTNEGGVIAEEYIVLYARDRTETFAQVWLGTTANCCTCHDHKFDPFTMRDFYSLSAFFNNTTQGAMDGNIPNTPPVIFVPKKEDRPRWEALAADLDKIKLALKTRKEAAKGDFDAWLGKAKIDELAKDAPGRK